MQVNRHFTRAGLGPYADITFVPKDSRIVKLDGTVVFEAKSVMVPDSWDQVATDILAQKYFRRRGCNHTHVDSLYNSPYASAFHADGPHLSQPETAGAETDLREAIHRIVGCWTYWGERYGYLKGLDAQAFYDELSYMMARQMFAPNSPQWFNTGLHYAYGITGEAQGHFYFDPLDRDGKLKQSKNAYEHPQTSACQPYNAMISTPYGPTKIGDVVKFGMVGLEVFDKNNTTKVKAVKNNGVKPVLRVITKSGHTLDATADHQILVTNHRHVSSVPFWTTVGELRPGQNLVYRSNTSIKDVEVSEEAVAEAFLAGWLQGDGHVGIVALSRGTSMVIEAMTADADEHKAVMHALALVFPNATPNIIEVETASAEINLKRVRFYGKEQCAPFVDKYNLLERREAMHVPMAVIDGGKKTVVAYLRALFQADGYVSSRVSDDINTHLVALDTISQKLMEEVHVLLSNLGIFSRIKVKKEPREDRQDHHSINIQVKSERQKFHDMIGFVSSRKQEKLLATLAPEVPGRSVEDEKALQIERIEHLGEQEVYDIQTESENYLCGNIVVHNCFIQSIQDDLVGPGGIMDLWVREARLFKYGSGSGTNFSNIRGKNEKLSGGGVSSGLMSFLKVGDAAGGAIKSGGTSRRAAKMVILNADHPDIEEFVQWKVVEEHKVAMLATGSQIMAETWEAMVAAFLAHQGDDHRKLPGTNISKYPHDLSGDPSHNKELAKVLRQAMKQHVPGPFLDQCLKRLEQNDLDLDIASYDVNWEAEGYNTVSSMNANNSVRVTDEFMQAVEEDLDWHLTARKTGEVVKTIKARDLWKKIVHAAWMCADPGLQFHDTYNNWHTGLGTGPINATNPCSEYAYLDDTACNLASLRLTAFLLPDGGFDFIGFEHACRLVTLALEITVAMSQYPYKDMAQNSNDHRTLGLGYADLGALLMNLGVAYDSDEGRLVGAGMASLMTATAYNTSADIAQELGAYPAFKVNQQHMTTVLHNHAVATGVPGMNEFLGLNPAITTFKLPYEIHSASSRSFASLVNLMLTRSATMWKDTCGKAEMYGVRNAQVTVLAPTGTIGLVMGCDTTGVEPDFALVKFKKLAGGGYFKIVNGGVEQALRNLGYDEAQIENIKHYATGVPVSEKLLGSDQFAKLWLAFGDTTIDDWNAKLPGAFDPAHVLPVEKIAGVLGADYTAKLMLALGGAGTVEGAPGLKPEHLSIFDCANKCGKTGTRFIAPDGHLMMMAAIQPFISGSISKTVNLPATATLQDVANTYMNAWKTGVKSIALYRDGSKMSQALATNMDLLHGVDLLLDDEAPVQAKVEAVAQALVKKATRHKLPGRRTGYTQAARIGETKIYLRTGEYEDGTLGEIFLDTHKEGTAMRALLNSFAICISIGLQHGIPLEEYCDAYLFTKFEPHGGVQGHDAIKRCTSILDYIFRDLAISYLGRHELAHIDPADLINESGPSKPMGRSMSRGMTFGIVVEDEPAGVDIEAPISIMPPVPPPAYDPKPDPKAQAKLFGFTGDVCPSCGHFTMVRNGTCLKCNTCGSTTGCS